MHVQWKQVYKTTGFSEIKNESKLNQSCQNFSSLNSCHIDEAEKLFSVSDTGAEMKIMLNRSETGVNRVIS